MKRFLILSIVSLLIFLLELPVCGDNQAPLTLKNITVEMMGNQNYDLEANIVTSNGHARVTIDDAVIEADSLTYYGNQNKIVASGNIRMLKKDLILTANQLVLDTSTGWLELSGAAQFVSPAENYRSETIRYNLKQMTGSMGPLQGVVKGTPKDFYLTGKEAQLSEGTTVISSATLTRSPWLGNPDYVFVAPKMVVAGEDIYMEKVVLKFFGAPIGYLPRMVLQGAAAPRINLSANQDKEIDLSQVIDKADGPAVSSRKPDKVHVSPRYQVSINSFDKPSMITVGRIYSWNNNSDEVDLNFDSRGIFSFSDIYQIDWTNYNLTIDGNTDLSSQPQRELGVAFTKKAWKTNYGNWQVGLVTRLLYNEREDHTAQGIYGGCRLDYQLNPDLNLSYLYLDALSGTDQDWERLERDFLVINDYRLGSNFIYSLNIPLSPHYFIINKGYYSSEKNSWTSQIVLLAREVGNIRAGAGWDFAKNFVELTFKLNY